MLHTRSTIKRIAVIGAGFCGLSLCYELSQLFQVTLFERKEIGGGASGIAAGLLHYYVGAHAKKNWRGEEGLEATLQLLKISSQALNRPVWEMRGILRPAITNIQNADFQISAKKYDDIDWLSEQQSQEYVQGCPALPALLIRKGVSVDCMGYLQGLWKACIERGVMLEIEEITQLEKLEASFDAVVVAAGADSRKFTELKSLGIHPVKGQILELDVQPPSIPINSQAYVMRYPQKKSCLVGATYEQEFASEEPNVDIAVKEVMHKAIAVFPEIANASILNCQAGIRASSPNHMPIWKHIKNKIWALSGMGSKGLLYHALGAKELCIILKSALHEK